MPAPGSGTLGARCAEIKGESRRRCHLAVVMRSDEVPDRYPGSISNRQDAAVPCLHTIRTVPLFAVLGLVSGIVTVAIVNLRPDWHISIPGDLNIWPLSVVPGLVFGLVIGLGLLWRVRASPAVFVGYIVAATLCNFAAVTLTTEVLLWVLEQRWVAGIVAGVFGSACLTACTLALLPVARKARPAVLTVVAGGALGALLGPAAATDGLFWWYVFYGAWHSGYAASFATALPLR